MGQIGAYIQSYLASVLVWKDASSFPPQIIRNRHLALEATACSGTGGRRFALV